MKNTSRLLLITMFASVLLGISACLKDDEETLLLPTPRTIGDVPSDYSATLNPDVGYTNAIIPNYQIEEEEEEDGLFLYRMDMTGIMNPETHEWLNLYGTSQPNQNTWLSLDGTPKGILVKNHSEDANVSNKIDLVFLVDNSGSMGEESDAIARDIVNWANNLVNSGVDIRFGCVGYTETGELWLAEYNQVLNGAIDLTSHSELHDYLNHGTGVERTQHFGGANASVLQNQATQYTEGLYEATGHADWFGECGMMALRFADTYFSFRNGANRIYVNFTDEPNQPMYIEEWSVEYLNPSHGYWLPQQGTVHTVFSGSTNFTNSVGLNEKPWLVSEYTGGTVLYTNASFSGVSLNDLPVTGAMQHSYSIYFTVPESLKDGQSHNLRVTVLSQDRMVRAERHFSIRFD